ncbi:MAG: type II 3-dehydroquinate dehydratase [Burkholderiaceae bacterium]|jgi:3-dehydroquinate dehydratase-2|nr:type II 3-dehydroquinate dehydratase [Burkholderiaceae bacterium]HMN65918.1 type II 3-dehydroquinate dehydratase [Burkholderiaceae bacterium]
MSRLLWVIHGPNLNLLGEREPGVYGTTTLAQIDADLAKVAKAHGLRLESFQSNHEGALVDRIQSARGAGVDFIVINPAAFTHTSVALRDALAAAGVPFIEVHLSNIHRREPFRHHSYLSDLAAGVVVGLGPIGYRLAVQAAIESLRTGEATAARRRSPRKG